MKAVTRLLCSLGLILALTAQSRAATGIVKTIGGSYTPGYVDGNNLVSLFNQPSGLAVDLFGRLLVADFGNNAVRFITLDDDVTGTFTRSNVNGPIAVAVTGLGDVLVVNYNSGNVARFDRNGAFLSLFATNLANPTAITIDTSGNVFVAAQAGGVRRYSSTGAFVQSYSVSGQGNPDFRGIVVALDGTIAVTDAGNNVVWKFPIQGGGAYIFAGSFNSAGFANGSPGFGKLNSPQQIGISPSGILVVADRLNHRVRAVDGAGVLSTLYGIDPATWEGAPASSLPGWADGAADLAELHDPVGITVDSTGTVFDSEVFYGVIRQASGLTFPTNSTGGNNSGPSGATKNQISLGFAGGEASSDFIGAPGQRFTAPITLTLVPGQKIYGLQLNTTITPANDVTPGGPFDPAFSSHLLTPDIGNPNHYYPIDPKLFISKTAFVSQQLVTVNGVTALLNVTNYLLNFAPLVITNSIGNLIGVGWVERIGETNLYDTKSQDLIRYSQAHDYIYDGTLGKVVVGVASFRIPPNAPMTAQYQFNIGRPSANSDGLAQDVVIETPDGTDTSNPISATRVLNMGIRKYLVGDVVPFRWFNAGDFGDNSILNNDIEQLQEVFAYGYDIPPVGSDMYDALDSCCIGADGTNYSDPTLFQFASSDTLNQIAYGDGQITLEDLYVTFRRSLDPGLTNYIRYWSNGALVAEATTNLFRGKAADAGSYRYKKPALSLAHLDEDVSAKFTAGNAKASPAQVVHIPISVDIAGPLSLSSIMLKIAVVGIDDTPALPTSISFTPNLQVGTPTVSKIGTGATFSGIWFEIPTPLTAGSHTLGTIDLVMPATANSDTLYSIQIDAAQASAGLTRFPVTTSNGFVLSADRALAPWTDEIPDAWRIQYFGSLMNILSAPDADADGDGMTNLQEYRAGTNPNDVTSRFAVNGSNSATGVTLKWPTVTGKTYRLESASALTGAVWTVIEDSITGTGGIIERTQPSNNGQTRFYRVHTN